METCIVSWCKSVRYHEGSCSLVADDPDATLRRSGVLEQVSEATKRSNVTMADLQAWMLWEDIPDTALIEYSNCGDHDITLIWRRPTDG